MVPDRVAAGAGKREPVGRTAVGAPTADTQDDHSADVAGRPHRSASGRSSPVVAATPDEQLAVEQALERFRNAGLWLPDVEIVFHDDPEGCKGHDGLFHTRQTAW